MPVTAHSPSSSSQPLTSYPLINLFAAYALSAPLVCLIANVLAGLINLSDQGDYEASMSYECGYNFN
jgi:hypothetical protein